MEEGRENQARAESPRSLIEGREEDTNQNVSNEKIEKLLFN